MVKRRKKKGHVAIPFLIAFLLSMILIGGVAVYLFDLIGGDNETIIKNTGNVKKPGTDSNMTLLFVLDEDEAPEPLTFLIARVCPADKKIMFVSMPTNMLSVVGGRQATLADFYNNGGAQQLKEAIAYESEIVVDRYIILDSEAFQKISNIFAGVNYVVPAGTRGFTESNAPQYLGPSQMEKLITYPLFENGETQRSAMVADIITEMVNQTDYERIAASMDSNFKTLINMVETDISAIDYKNHKDALKYMYTYGSEIAVFRIAMGGSQDENDDVFILSGNFYNTVKEFFEETVTPRPTEAASETKPTEE
ncbi:MAG: LCP family protein [Oscillospiraceae bacterium]|nr:LCP family protein [Oscillospiraceae bacterium]